MKAVVDALGAAAALRDASPAELTPMLATIRSELLMGGRLMSEDRTSLVGSSRRIACIRPSAISRPDSGSCCAPAFLGSFQASSKA